MCAKMIFVSSYCMFFAAASATNREMSQLFLMEAIFNAGFRLGGSSHPPLLGLGLRQVPEVPCYLQPGKR